jgi:hypothetical protein
LAVDSHIRLPKDSLDRVRLLSSLDSLLMALSDTNDNTDKWIMPTEKESTALLLDEMKGMTTYNDIPMRTSLISVEPLDSTYYLVRLAYLGTMNASPFLRGLVELIACRDGDCFRFTSPLDRNTRQWERQANGHLSVFYPSNASQTAIEKLTTTLALYDTRLNIKNPLYVYFCSDCSNMPSMLRLIGIDYQAEANGLDWSMVDFTLQGREYAFYSNKDELDPHDMFHWRAAKAIPTDKQNHYMICGCAYVYGGSWGISWKQIQEIFKRKMLDGKRHNWLKLYFERYNFGENDEKHLLVTQYINAKIIEKVEKENGFPAVMKLLSSGNMIKDKTHFFSVLNEVAGINEQHFNAKVEGIIAK